MTNTVPCANCGREMPEERLEVFPTCMACTDQTPYLGAVEGASKTQQVHIVKAGSEDARRAFNSGKCIVNRSAPASVRARKNPRGT